MELKKTRDGWEARQSIELGEFELDGKPALRVLSVSLRKSIRRRQALTLYVNAARVQGMWARHEIGYGTPGADFVKAYEMPITSKRITSKVIEREWFMIVEPCLAEIEAQARAHYQGEVSA